MYCDPPAVQNPAIRADNDELTARERRSNENKAIVAVRDETAVTLAWLSDGPGYRDTHTQSKIVRYIITIYFVILKIAWLWLEHLAIYTNSKDGVVLDSFAFTRS